MLWPNSVPDRWYLTVSSCAIAWMSTGAGRQFHPITCCQPSGASRNVKNSAIPAILESKNHTHTVTHIDWHYLPPKQLLRATPAFPIAFCRWDDARSSACRGPLGKGAGTPGSSKYPKIMCRFQCICGTISTCLNSFSILGRSIRVYTCLHSLTCMPLYSHPPTSSPPEKMGSNCCKGTGFIPTELFMVSQGGPPNNKQVYIIPLFTTVISSWTFKPQLNQIKSQFSII